MKNFILMIDTVKGESQETDYEEQIDVISWNWLMKQSGTAQTGKGSGAGKANVSDLTVTKYLDNATATLMKHCCAGKPFNEAVLICRKAGGDKPLDYMKITMEQVIVSSVSSGGAGDSDRLTETITLNFAKYKAEYTPQLATGGGGAAVTAAWNVAKNVEE